MKQPEVIRQLQSPLASGRFGLTSAVQESPIAYLSSVVSCLSSPTLSQLLQEMSGSPHDASSTSEVSMLHRHLEQCIITIRSALNADSQQSLRADLIPTSASQLLQHYQQHHMVIPFLQQELKSQVNKLTFQTALTHAAEVGDSITATRLLAVSAEGASEWKTTTPSSSQLSLCNTHYQIAAKMNLGVAPLSLPSHCTSCHSPDACANDPLHPLVCKAHMGTDITIRHDDVKNTLYLSAHHAGGLARKEPSRLSANGDNTRPDLQMVLNGQQYLIDMLPFDILSLRSICSNPAGISSMQQW